MPLKRLKKLRGLSFRACIDGLLRKDSTLLQDLPSHVRHMLIREALKKLEAFYIDVTSRHASGNHWNDGKYLQVTCGGIHTSVPDSLKGFSPDDCKPSDRHWSGARETARLIISLRQQERELSGPHTCK
jgi:hypothetical protein